MRVKKINLNEPDRTKTDKKKKKNYKIMLIKFKMRKINIPIYFFLN